MPDITYREERLTPEAYIEFLTRTDFAYWLLITDLGVDRAYVRQDIGQTLMRMAHELAGGEKDVILYTCANENAVGFYKKLGMRPAPDTMVLDHIDWTPFTVEEA